MTAFIDYAHPMMMAEKKLKTAHDLLLDRKYDEATDELYQVLVEARLAIHSVRHVKEQENAIR